MARYRRSKEEWVSLIQEFMDSGKSAREWSGEKEISYPSLIFWRKKLKTSSYFVELKRPKGTFELRWKVSVSSDAG